MKRVIAIIICMATILASFSAISYASNSTSVSTKSNVTYVAFGKAYNKKPTLTKEEDKMTNGWAIVSTSPKVCQVRYDSSEYKGYEKAIVTVKIAYYKILDKQIISKL